MSTAYQMTEEVGEYGSGTPSPLYIVCELIRELYELEIKLGWEISMAHAMAQYPMTYLKQLRGEIATDSDAISKLNSLLKNTADANYLLAGRDLKDLTPGELKEFESHMTNIAAVAGELGLMTDEQRQAVERSYPGAPIPRERIRVAER